MRDPTEWIYLLCQNFLGYLPIIILIIAGLYFAEKPWFDQLIEGALLVIILILRYCHYRGPFKTVFAEILIEFVEINFFISFDSNSNFKCKCK